MADEKENSKVEAEVVEEATVETTEEAPEQTEVAVAIGSEVESKPRPSRDLPSPPEGRHYFWGTGRRKSAVARVRIRPGKGEFLINKREIDNYFTAAKHRNDIIAPLLVTRMKGNWDVYVNVGGGGLTGQAGAVQLGLARALCKAMSDVVEADLRSNNLMTRDSRVVERKKYGQKGARKRFQFSKR